ncbi:MAG: tRNA (guanosine(37)-N1)-methyltransferase TrmD [Lactobacillales bacterium]|jgi:tRNA (guanine37-N1)-methyltransferase|nr:tRNA (guanosine(37)-N1)-methyltransferase TrmD [Lactobacillales bacterium]
MKINVLTLFPDMFPGFLGCSLAGQALKDKKWELNVVNIRDFATDKYKSVDDTPFGGGAGMVMKPDVLDAALTAVYKTGPLYYPSPRGKVFGQATAKEWSELPEITFLCGRFEGIDERIFEKWPIEEISLGDFVLSGGEAAVLPMLDATIRLIPSVMGNKLSLMEESFSNGLLEYPQYTKPARWQDKEVPDILLSGHHEKIKKWRLTKAEEITQERRPDLWIRYTGSNKKKG